MGIIKKGLTGIIALTTAGTLFYLGYQLDLRQEESRRERSHAAQLFSKERERLALESLRSAEAALATKQEKQNIKVQNIKVEPAKKQEVFSPHFMYESRDGIIKRLSQRGIDFLESYRNPNLGARYMLEDLIYIMDTYKNDPEIKHIVSKKADLLWYFLRDNGGLRGELSLTYQQTQLFKSIKQRYESAFADPENLTYPFNPFGNDRWSVFFTNIPPIAASSQQGEIISPRSTTEYTENKENTESETRYEEPSSYLRREAETMRLEDFIRNTHIDNIQSQDIYSYRNDVLPRTNLMDEFLRNDFPEYLRLRQLIQSSGFDLDSEGVRFVGFIRKTSNEASVQYYIRLTQILTGREAQCTLIEYFKLDNSGNWKVSGADFRAPILNLNERH